MTRSIKEHPISLRRFAAIVGVITVFGAVWPVVFNGGSAAGQLLVRTHEIEAVGDAGFEAVMEADLYGETREVSGPVIERDRASIAAHVSFLRDLDRGLAILCLLLTAGLPFLFGKWPKVAWLYLLPAAWLLVNAHAVAVNGGKAFAELAVPAHATRWGMFVVFALLLSGNLDTDRIEKWVLRIVCALTFATHGWEAFQLNPPFQDLLYTTFGHVGIELSESVCNGLLRAIGVMDVLLAVGVTVTHFRPLLLWMGFWGLITAASRPLAMGFDAWPEFAMRLPNSAAPMMLVLIGTGMVFSLSPSKTPRKQEPATR